MPSSQDVAILKGGDVRIFVQDSASPSSPYYYYGCTSLDGPTQDLGEPTPIYCPSSAQRNRWDIVDEVSKAPALGTTDFTQHADRYLRDVWWDLKDRGCTFNVQAVIGRCQTPSDFTQWDSKLLLARTRLTKLALGALSPLAGDNNDAIDMTGSLSFRDFGPIKAISGGEVASAAVVAEVLDGLFSDSLSCGECGVASDGCQKLYWLTTANPGSPGLSSQIVYSLDGGATWASLDIPALGGLSGNRVDDVGSMLVVVSEAKGGHVYQLLSQIDAGTIAWVLSTSGYVAGKSPRCIWSKSPFETYVGAAGGYVYLMTDPTLPVVVISDGSSTTQNLNDIHGYGQVVVAVGGSNAVIKSDNNGETWSLVVGPAVGVNLTAVWCMSKTTWLVGTGNGKLYYTTNSGLTWTQIQIGLTGAVVNDIKFYDDTVGYMAIEIGGGVGRVYRTTDSGHTWQYQAPHISGLPSAYRWNAVAPCGRNEVAAGGIKTVGGDGVLAIAE